MHGEKGTEGLSLQRVVAWWFFLSTFAPSKDINGKRVDRNASLSPNLIGQLAGYDPPLGRKQQVAYFVSLARYAAIGALLWILGSYV